MQRHHKRFGNASLSLVSLMDIFTILVFFLLFNSSGDHQLPNAKTIKLPESVAEEKPRDHLVIMVSAKDVIVGGRRIVDVQSIMANKGEPIAPLSGYLLQLAGTHWDQEAVNSEEGLNVTLLADKKVPYKVLKHIMQTLAETPYRQISLAVSKKAAASGGPAK
ncbi:MAG: biopolymer transporter ExbD [Gammaproteobacteria bacterium]|nr:biopolymer transporter ExbD [Gammaproteobacteria bacterium]